MNYHTDKWIINKMQEHFNEALQYFPEEQIVGLFYQGSGNYGLDTVNSDVDTKLVILPTLEDIALNKKAISITHVRENTEHIDFKDARLMLQTFKKQNVNFLEVLFTPYKIIQPDYADIWNLLTYNAEKIARYNPLQCIKSMRGIALEKYYTMEHKSPSKIETINKYGYDPKLLYHLVRIEEFLAKYIADKPFKNCLISQQAKFLKDLKFDDVLSLDCARLQAEESLEHIEKLYTSACDHFANIKPNEEVEQLLDDVQYQLIERNLTKYHLRKE